VAQDIFLTHLLTCLDELHQRVCTAEGEWTIKGFIDTEHNIYPMSVDTKVLSKVIELIAFPIFARFAEEQHYNLVVAPAQNYYPDLSFVSKTDVRECYAVDIKTTYRTHTDKSGDVRVNGMTLGTFGGYFRIRHRPVNSTFAYNQYRKHYVLGIVYDRVDGVDERLQYDLANLSNIPSVARNFIFFLQEKYRIASDIPGSGNTKNIGSTRSLDRLIQGSGVFSKLGISVFDDYWMNYRTRSMAQAEGFESPPYTNLREYQSMKRQGLQILEIPFDELESDIDSNE